MCLQVFQGVMREKYIEESNNHINTTIISDVLSTASPIADTTQTNDDSSHSFEKNEVDQWPEWAKYIQCISHLLLTFYSSVTFLIYYAKQKRSGIRGN